MIYVLAPATRPAWDRAELGPAFLVARDLARSVASVREHRRLPADAPPFPEANVVQAHVPLRWIAALGVAAVATGRDDGWELLDEMWPAARPAVLELARDAAGSLRRAARAVLSRLPVPPTGRLDLRLLGPLELRRSGVLVDAPDWRRERVRSLLACLALHRTISRERLAEILWPGLERSPSSLNLRVTLTYLLRVLEPDRGPRDPSFFVRQHGGSLSLHPGEWLTVDLWEFDALCEQADHADRTGSPVVALDRALRAAELWRSEPTELLSEPWAVAEIEQRRRRFATVATRAGELVLAKGNIDGAHALAERALALDPWLEATHRLLVAAHLANHDDLAARRALGRYREAIHDLGFSPGEATLMVERLLDSATLTYPNPAS
jgi:DNA-binding SARP family transcriptional activator